MIGVIVATHAGLAEELVRATRMIVGDVPFLEAFPIDPSSRAAEIRERMEELTKAVDQGQGVVILTDMFGGTPSNIGLTMVEAGKIEILTGVNLPMLIKLATYRTRETDLRKVVSKAAEEGRKNIIVASDYLEKG